MLPRTVESGKAAGSASLPQAYHVVWCGFSTTQRQSQSQLYRVLGSFLPPRINRGNGCCTTSTDRHLGRFSAQLMLLKTNVGRSADVPEWLRQRTTKHKTTLVAAHLRMDLGHRPLIGCTPVVPAAVPAAVRIASGTATDSVPRCHVERKSLAWVAVPQC